MAAWLALLPFVRLEEGLGGDHHDATRSAATMPLDRGLLTISVALLFLYVGVEAGVSSWLGEYFVGFLGTSPAQGALMVMLFWGGVLGGRLLLAFCYHGTRAAEAILLLAVVALAGLAAAVTVNDRTVAAVGFVATGFGFSSIYPLVMSIVGRFFALRHQSMVIGFATTGGGIGSFLFPFVMALVAEQAGIRRGYLLYVAVSALLVLLSVAAVLKTRPRRGRRAPLTRLPVACAGTGRTLRAGAVTAAASRPGHRRGDTQNTARYDFFGDLQGDHVRPVVLEGARHRQHQFHVLAFAPDANVAGPGVHLVGGLTVGKTDAEVVGAARHAAQGAIDEPLRAGGGHA